jgi:large subunit ribosomal protein L21
VGDVIDVDSIEGNVGDTVSFDHVLLTGEKDKTTVGTPVVTGVKVKAKIIGQARGEKIDVRRYKSKVRYRRQKGFRASRTQLEITAIR